ncbi:MAG TPA: hypothetical protein VIJ39_10360 [Solirubrobacteraceae bacterium]
MVRHKLKPALASIPIGFSLWIVACGGENTGARRPAARPPAGQAAQASLPSASVSFTPRLIEGDEDGDGDGEQGGASEAGRGKHHPRRLDNDDRVITAYGQPASSADRQAIVALVERYYRAAVADDATSACSLLFSLLAESIPEDYGQEPGPTYLRGLKSCPAILLLMLQHARSELASEIEVIGVRVRGKRAYVLLGSATKPASYLIVHREARTWKIDQMLPGTLP